MYRVVVRFRDLQDGNRVYNVGDKFPRDGLVVNDARLRELSSNRNRRKIPLIKMVSKASPVAEKTPEAYNPIETPVEKPKPKRKERKSRGKNA